MSQSLRIAIDARLTTGAPGGLMQVVIGMAHGLSRLDDGNEEYSFLVRPDYDGWLDEYLGRNCRVQHCSTKRSWRRTIRKVANRFGRCRPEVAHSDGCVERNGFDGVHFLLAMGFKTRLPNVYHVHDLQHLHYPEHFCRRTLAVRSVVFDTLCRQASRVFTMTNWGKQDLVQRIGMPAEKVAVVPWGSVLSAYSEPSPTELKKIQDKYQLAQPFAFYPAKAYPHKNHLGLLQAVAQLRDRHGLILPLLFSGAQGVASNAIERTIADLGLGNQVRHLGFVEPDVVAALFRLCHCLVFPSLFEGWGLPITEAMSLRKPIACSNATCLPEVARDAAIYFDPRRPEEIAEALARIWIDVGLRQQLACSAEDVAATLTWENTARQFRSHYRDLFGSKANQTAAVA